MKMKKALRKVFEEVMLAFAATAYSPAVAEYRAAREQARRQAPKPPTDTP